MKTILAKIKNSKGFVSLETVAVGLIILVIAAIIMTLFKNTTKTSTDRINNEIESNVGQIVNEGTFSNPVR